ncbi:MAG: Mov34/MPN/PAD-1 family protein [Nitrososphaeraceae archaeon]
MIIFDSWLVEKLRKSSNNAFPNELFAFLLGRKKNDVYVIKDILNIKNYQRSPSFFNVDDDILLKYYNYDNPNLDIVSIFHSHHDSPHPSKTDEKYMLINPVVWIIYSISKDKFCAYLHDSEKIIEVPIKFTKV